jgi:flagellar hook assembly protein FlgD
MGTFHGNEGEVHLGANTVAEVKSFQHTNSAESADDSAAGDEYRTRKAGKKDGQGQMEFHWDPSDTNGQVALAVGSELAVVLYPSGITSGKGKLTGSIFVESVQVTMDQDDICGRAITYKNFLTEGVVAP